MTFFELAQFLARLEATSSRLQITQILAELFAKTNQEEIDKVCYLTQGCLAPSYEGLEFNLAEKLLIRAVARAADTTETEVKKLYQQKGDLGDVVKELRIKSRRSGIKLTEVYGLLRRIARESGEGSVERKIDLMADLLRRLDSLSAKYVARIPLGKLRLGFSELTILDALSWLMSGDKRHREEIERAYEVRADIGAIAKLVKTSGLQGLKTIEPEVGVPILSALCQRLPAFEEMIEKMGEVAVEPKYDGSRVQIHYRRKLPILRIFTRNLENVTHMYPDLVRAVKGEIKADEVILDGEAVGFDPRTDRILPFQETIKRKRKYEIALFSQSIPLKCFVFDILVYNGRNMMTRPLNERRKILERVVLGGTLVLTPQIVTQKIDELKRFYDRQIARGLEGVVAKKWDSVYDPGRRGFNWVKLKSETSKKGAGLADTLDCAVMGLYRGKGKRTGFGVGAFLVGVRRSENIDNFLSVSKIGTGLTDEQFRELKARSEQLIANSKQSSYQVDKNLEPDVWLKPGLVVEIQADNITVSPIHTAGYALRFPRLVRFRDDKKASQATTLAELKKLYQLQKR
ncbi:MAG: ATP-dependent DNA ligase [Candidatus Shapirobacteria bacterium]